MTSKNSKQIVIISGPTASGKANLGISIAKKYNGYIINADCRQIYKGFQTLCASPSTHDQAKVSMSFIIVWI